MSNPLVLFLWLDVSCRVVSAGLNYRMRETVRVGHVAKVTLKSEGIDRTVDVVTASDESTGLRAFQVDNLLSEEECREIRETAKGEDWVTSEVNKPFPVMQQLKKKEGREQAFEGADQNGDRALDGEELSKFLKEETDIVDHNHTDFMVNHVGGSARKFTRKAFMNFKWQRYFDHAKINQKHLFARSSTTAWLTYSRSSALKGLLEKVAAVTDLPHDLVKKKAEDLQLLRYEPGGAHYSCHHDSSPGEENMEEFRFMTFFLFLNDVEDGGETVLFGTDLNGTYPERTSKSWVRNNGWEDLESACQPTTSCPSYSGGPMPDPFRSALVVKPKAGSALFWYNTEIDEKGRGKKFVWSSLHGGCPTRSGEKWAANVWLSAGPYLKNPEQSRHEL